MSGSVLRGKIQFNHSLLQDLQNVKESNEVLKFDLFLIAREIEQVAQQLTQISLLPQEKKQAWVTKNESILRFFMSDLSIEVLEIFQQLSFDHDATEESITCINRLKELVTVANQLLKVESKSREPKQKT